MKLRIRPFANELERLKWLDYQVTQHSQYPDMDTAVLKTIGHTSLTIGVNSLSVFTTRDLTGLAIIGLGRQYSEHLPALNPYETRLNKEKQLRGVYATLGVKDEGQGHGRRLQAHAIGLAFRSGVFSSDPQAERKERHVLMPIHGLENLRTHFFAYTPMLAEGLDNQAIADIYGCGVGSINKDLSRLNGALETDRAELVMLAGGLGVLDRTPQ